MNSKAGRGDSAHCRKKRGRGRPVYAKQQEERFSRKKHDSAFPAHAIRYCLSEASISLADVNHVVFYDKPLVKFERLLETYLSYAPRGLRSFVAAMPIWLKDKLYLKATLKKEFGELADDVDVICQLAKFFF